MIGWMAVALASPMVLTEQHVRVSVAGCLSPLI
jgi:hypothetical protein